MIRVTELKTRYSKKTPEVLRGVSFRLNQGEVGVLLGPNGSGKSTLLKCVLGLMKYEGAIVLDGLDTVKPTSRQRSKLVAYVPQNLSFAPSTAFDAVMVGRIPHFAAMPTKEDHEEVLRALDDVGMLAFASRNVEELSGGERQKIALARALAQKAKVLVCDEPTSNLDIAAEQNVVSLLKGLAKEKGLTVLVSMHDLNLALSIGDRFLFLKDGLLAADLTAQEVDAPIIKDVFSVESSRVSLNGREYIVFGGKDE